MRRFKKAYVDSEARSAEFPKPFRSAEVNPIKEQHRLSKMIRNQRTITSSWTRGEDCMSILIPRKDFLHKLSRKVANTGQKGKWQGSKRDHAAYGGICLLSSPMTIRQADYEKFSLTTQKSRLSGMGPDRRLKEEFG